MDKPNMNSNNNSTYYFNVQITDTTAANGYVFAYYCYDAVEQLDRMFDHPKKIHVEKVSDSNVVVVSNFESQKQ